MAKFDLLIFDFDGTLVNSIPPAIAAIQAMLRQLGYSYRSKDEINTYVGYGEIPLVSGSIGSDDPKKIEAAKEVYFNLYKRSLKTIPLYPHVEETLKSFQGLTLAIISNKQKELIDIILDHHGLKNLFSDILGGENSKKLKPDPHSVNEIIAKHKIAKAKTLFVGDMTVDVETGHNAGVTTCAVTYGFNDRAALITAKPDFLINDFSELSSLVI